MPPPTRAGAPATLFPPWGHSKAAPTDCFSILAHTFCAQGVETFYSQVSVTFEVRNPGEHYHVPLLLSPWGYTTYRGS